MGILPIKLNMQKNTPDPIIVDFFDLSSSGECVGKSVDGKIIFAYGAIPGEKASVRIYERHPKFERAIIETLLKISPNRQNPLCQLAETKLCGGCPWMHISLDSQLKSKEGRVKNALRKIPVFIEPIQTICQEHGYRIRARLIQKQGFLGFQAARSSQVTSITFCATLDPELNKTLPFVSDVVSPMLLDGDTVYLLIGQNQQKVIHIETQNILSSENLQFLNTRLIDTNLFHGLWVKTPNSTFSQGCKEVNLGSPSLGPLYATAQGFAQVSFAAHQALVETFESYLAHLTPKKLNKILELYAGSGNFSRVLNKYTQQLVAVENDSFSSQRLINLQLNNTTIVKEDAYKACLKFISSQCHFDLIVLDPPRTGAKDVCQILPQLSPMGIFYISCDVMTLARDLAILSQHKYQVRKVWPIDTMPNTPHLEVIAYLEKMN